MLIAQREHNSRAPPLDNPTAWYSGREPPEAFGVSPTSSRLSIRQRTLVLFGQVFANVEYRDMILSSGDRFSPRVEKRFQAKKVLSELWKIGLWEAEPIYFYARPKSNKSAGLNADMHCRHR